MRAAEATGLLAKYTAQGQRLSPHALRHAYATHCYEGAMELDILAKLLGHSFLSDTVLYVHCSPEMEEREYARSEV